MCMLMPTASRAFFCKLAEQCKLGYNNVGLESQSVACLLKHVLVCSSTLMSTVPENFQETLVARSMWGYPPRALTHAHEA